MDNSKLIFIDVDGTLTRGKSSWEIVHHHFEINFPGMVDKMNYNTKLWEDGKIDYNTWAQMDVALWKGLQYAELSKALLPPDLVPGARKGIDMLKDRGFKVVLVSGGINVLVDKVKEMVGADEAYSNIILEKDGVISGEVDIPVGNTKVKVIEEVMKAHNVDVSNTYAIGDHVNDIEMFDFVTYSLGVNIKKEIVREHANEVIEMTDFTEASRCILNLLN